MTARLYRTAMPFLRRRRIIGRGHFRGPVAAGTALFAIAAAVSATAGDNRDMPDEGGLTVAILDLAQAPGLAPPIPARAQYVPWRTSFGSERRSPPKTKPASGDDPLAALADIDAVLIQGVHAGAPLRRYFPPRTWRLIVSRGLAATTEFGRATASDALPTTTAIAIKARPDLRVTARALALRLEPPDATAETLASSFTAATAIRLVEQGRAIWLASVALPPACSGTAPCPARQRLEAWRETKRGQGELTLVGGRTHPELATQPAAAPTPVSPACGAHGIDSDVTWQPMPLPKFDGASRTPSGCINIVRLGSPSSPP